MDRENLCDEPVFTGYDRDGGFAEYAVADERFCFALPDRYDDAHAAPLLCAGLIGFRAWRLAGAATPRRIGLYGFGAAAHIICQVAVARGQEVYAFTRAGDAAGQAFARRLGAAWAGSSADAPPVAAGRGADLRAGGRAGAGGAGRRRARAASSCAPAST